MGLAFVLPIACSVGCGTGGWLAVWYVRSQLRKRGYRPSRWLVTGETGLLVGTTSAGAFTGGVGGLLLSPDRPTIFFIAAVSLTMWGALISYASFGIAGLLHCYGDEENNWKNFRFAWRRSSSCVALFEFPLLLLVGFSRLF